MSEYRSSVAWFGTDPTESESREFENRQLQLIKMNSSCLADTLMRYRGAVFSVTSNNVKSISMEIWRLGKDLFDAGLRVDIIARDDATLGLIQNELKKYGLFTRMNPITAPAHHVVPERIAL